jgi:hypothetical protein
VPAAARALAARTPGPARRARPTFRAAALYATGRHARRREGARKGGVCGGAARQQQRLEERECAERRRLNGVYDEAAGA